MKHTLTLLLLVSVSLAVEANEQQRVENETEKTTKVALKQLAAQTEEQAGQAEGATDQQPLIWVFRHSRVKQCVGEEMSLDQSRAKLTDKGVAVHQSHCGFRTDSVYTSGCGEPSGDILLHLIRGNSLDAALEVGYGPAQQIEYRTVQCPAKKT
ncbi:hypothetical protein SAMN04487965_0756 [Microbulbifer donghaiensis]|uniref:Uncharacterized protein n=1 Tax=Microbulbifer donghaiensis TaxID=494016 RepID=A0A1M4WR98_9GAMM|nr:hypothetical protein [Microbulbifer donghaiensis]SHE83677.1 hypothetical protein SAMN04487965_0756 [Microbulbifer donghaiensis]